MDNKDLMIKVDALKDSVDTLILIELCKQGATRDQARKVLGGMRNETFSKLNTVFNGKTKK